MRAPHVLTGWWRYSRLTVRRLGLTTTGVVGGWTGTALTGTLGVTLAAVALTVALVGQVGLGVIRAEQARRYGCW